MDGQTRVAVHLIAGDGSSGRSLGSGRLAHPLLVVMNGPLPDDVPTSGEDAMLRFAIFGSDGTEPVLEIVDAKGPVLRLVDHEDRDDLVAVALVAASRCQLHDAFADSTGIIQGGPEEVSRRMAEQPQSPSDSANSGIVLDPGAANWVCRLFRPPPWFCHEKGPGPSP